MNSTVSEKIANKTRRAAPVRQVRLKLVSIDVWSVGKYAFLLSLCWAIMNVVLSVIVYFALSQTGALGKVDELFSQIVGGDTKLTDIIGFGQVLGFSIITGIVNLIIGTALGMIMAVIYNQIAKIVGGLQLGFTNQ